jgi:hypothetical protein
MKKKMKQVLPFPAPLKERSDWIVIFELGDKRVAVRWEVQALPPPSPLLQWNPEAKKKPKDPR